ncbi:MAG TPA: T9SS type A sorting domain-containing protein [Chitinophagaceae bacterium]|nr:T9SS type A sorting domain-containing protein [Chitinophagaceae bacterium]
MSCKDHSEEEDEEKLEMDGMQKAMRQEFLMTRDPALNFVPKERLLATMRFMSTARTTQIADLAWIERGPNNIGGRSRAIFIDKRDPTGNTVFAASVSGGIFKSTNFTSPSANWTVVDDHMANLAVTVLVQDRNNFNIMYAGTGEGWFNVDAVRGAGIFKSIDGGITWNQLPSTAQFEYVQDIVIDNNGNVYASLRSLTSNNRGVVRSVNEGASWSQVLGTPLTDLAYTTSRGADLEVASNGDLYATLGIFSRTMVLKSAFATNGANTGAAGTWTDITPTHSNTTFRGEITVAPSNPQRLYLMMQDSATDKVLNFYTSSNGGTSWTSTSVASGSPLDDALNNGSSSQTWYDLISAVDSANANVIVVGGIELAKSTDGGSTWTAVSTAGSVHVDQHALVFLNSSNLLVGNDGGIYHTSNFANANPTFSQKNNGFSATQFYGCDFHPTDGNYFLAGAQDNNTQKFTSPGINSTTPVIGGDGAIPHISQTNGQLQIAASTTNTYYRSTDGGNTFNSLGGSINNGRGQFINPSDLDDNQKVLYAGDDIGKYYCITGLDGTPAASVKTITDMAGRGLTAVKVDPVAANTIWVGASSVDGSPSLLPPLLIKITNASSAAPAVLFTTTIPATNGSYISSIDVDRFNPNNVLVTFSNFGVTSVWESTDGGATFTSIEGNLPDMPVFCGIFAPPGAQLSGTTGGGIILGTDLGIWTASSVSGFTQWISNNNGLANVPVYMVKYRSANTSLVAATHGRGLFTTTLAGIDTGGSNNVTSKDFIKYISADAAQLLVVKGDLNTLNMQVQIFDASGKLMYNKEHPYQNLSIPISTLSKGSYVMRIQGNNKENFVQQFVKR